MYIGKAPLHRNYSFNIILFLHCVKEIVMHFLEPQMLDHETVRRHLSFSLGLFVRHLLDIEALDLTCTVEIVFEKPDPCYSSSVIGSCDASFCCSGREVLIFDWSKAVHTFLA